MKRTSSKHSSHEDKSCANCGTTRYSIKARGHCTRCYPILLRLEHAQRWDASQPRTLLHYPKPSASSGYSPNHWENDFPRIKEYVIRELKKWLLHFHSVEEQLAGRINGFDIEQELRNLVRRTGARNNALSKCADALDSSFTWEQRKLLFQLLTEVSESIKWGGINWVGFEWLTEKIAG